MTAALRQIGALRHRVVIERGETGPDCAVTWVPLATVWAAIEPTSAVEAERGGGLAGVVSHRVEIRWRADVDSRVRLRLGSRVFRVRAAHDLDERRNRLVIHAEEEGR